MELSQRRQQAISHSLLQYLHHRGRRADFRLADQNVEVLGHDDIADNLKPILPPNLLKNAEENIARTPASQKLLAFITATGNEMKVMMTVNPFQTRWHGAPL